MPPSRWKYARHQNNEGYGHADFTPIQPVARILCVLAALTLTLPSCRAQPEESANAGLSQEDRVSTAVRPDFE